MLISGTGITPFTCRVKVGYQVLTRPAIQWQQVSSGNWVGTDRGAAADVYESRFSIYGLETTINAFIDQIELNRAADNHVLSLSTFRASEYIFGENVDHSGTITATILETSKRRQGSWKGYGLEIYIRATSVSFTGSSSFPTLAYCEPGGEQDSNYTINKIDSYDGSMSYLDHKSDSGIFEGIFTLTNANFILLRNYIKATRTGNFTLSDTFGVDYPFGTRSANSYPFTVKLIEWEDMGWWGLKYNRIRLKFAEVV